jgi:RNA polymerase primary sigma factor
MKAVARYNYKMGYRLATFASWWIHKNVAQAVQSQSRTVRLPISMQKLRGKIFSSFYTLKRTNGEDPSPEEIADHIGESLPKVLEAMATADESISLETPVGDDGSVLADFIKDENARDPFVSLVEMEMARMARQVLARLTDRERKILTLRYGLEDGEDRSMAEVGRMMSLSRERIRQIEKRALERLRLPLIRQGLDSSRIT